MFFLPAGAFRCFPLKRLGWALALLAACAAARAGAARLDWDPRLGVSLRTESARITLDRNERNPAIFLRFWPGGASQSLAHAASVSTASGAMQLRLVYRAEVPCKTPLQVIRTLTVREEAAGATLLTEQFTLSATQPIRHTDIEIVRPFAIASDAPVTSSGELSLIRPLAAGWAEVTTVGQEVLLGEYRFAGAYPRVETVGLNKGARRIKEEVTTVALASSTPLLALPLVQVGGPGWRCAVMADPAFGSLFSVRMGGAGVSGLLSYYNPARAVALTSQTRTFAFRFQSGNAPRRPFDAAVEDYARLMRDEDVPPTPAWARRIALVDLADCADPAWLDGLRKLAGWLTPAERGQVAVVLRGWSNAIFPYGFDQERGGFDRAWLLPGGGAAPQWMSAARLRESLREARKLGFRVLLTMSEGLAADTGTPYFPADWALRDAKDNLVPTDPAGLAAYGPLALLSPAEPRLAAWYLAYTDALLAEFGEDLDGLVIGGAWRIPPGAAVARPRPAWGDAAFLELVRAVRARVKNQNPDLLLLTADRAGRGRPAAPYALAADGVLNAADLDPEAAIAGLFSCVHGVQWDAPRGGAADSRFQAAAWGARALRLPVTVGGALDPSRWNNYQRDRILKVFHDLRRRQEREDHAVYLREDSARLLATSPDRAEASAGDLPPAPAPGEVNWAADAATSASASSELTTFTALGAVRSPRGAGWVSAYGRNLPESLQVDFGAPREVRRFVVESFHDEHSTTATAANLGLTRYEIHSWDEKNNAWELLVSVDEPRAVRARVHVLEKPVVSRRVRLRVGDVAPLDGLARVARLEAWGMEPNEKKPKPMPAPLNNATSATNPARPTLSDSLR